MVLESNTLDVLFVKDGQQGEDGKVLYTWIKYAKDANGTGMTDDPNGAIYIGISYNNESSIESNDPTQYAWTKIQGADGKKGEDAYTIFLENENISFATDKNRNPLSEQAYTSGITIMKGAKPVTDFAIGNIAKTQGIAVAKTDTAIAISVVNGNPLPSDSGEIEIPITVGSTVFKKILTWTCAKKGDQGEKGERGLQGIQGPQGEQGIAGKDGTSVTITNKSITYQLSTSGTTIPTGTWQTTPQAIPEGQYQWTKTSVTYSDGNKTESYSISYHGKNGSDGTSVKTTSTSVKYQVGDSGTTKPTGTWQSNVPTVAQGKYLWTQTIVNYSDGNSTESYSVSYKGIDGSNGVNGMNAATIYLYQRATSTPSKPSNTLTYTFSTTTITGTLNNGWSTAIPTGTDAVYVTVASVSSKNDTATIATSAWSAPVVLAQNGKTGSDGKAGLNVATIYLYQRNISKPSKPSASVTYTFSTGVASGLNNGWSQKIPDGTNPLYVTLATASSNTATDTILSSEWSDVVVMAQNGEDGQDGISPKVSLSKSGNTTTISIVDATGTHTQTVKDGTSGTPGAAGKDGKTSYFHVKYSNDGGKTFTANSGEDTGIYMGSYTDYTEADSTDVKKYNWVKVKGDKGDTGQKGKDGTSIKITSKSVTYQTSTSGTTAPTGTWSTTVPTVNNGQYLWTKTTVQYSDGNKTEAYSVSYKGTNGTNGTSVTVSKTEVTYQVSTSGTNAPTGTWSTTMPSCDQGQYLWTKTYVKYSDGKDTTSYSVSYKGVDGADGQDGDSFAWNMLSHSSMIGEKIVCQYIEPCNSVTTYQYTDEGYHIVTPSSGNANNGIAIRFDNYKDLGIDDGESISFSCDIKGSTSSKPCITIRMSDNLWYGNDVVGKSATFTPTNNWQRFSVSTTTPSNLTKRHIWLAIHGNLQSDLYIKNLKLEKGISATPWSPSQSDIEGKGIAQTVQYYLATSQASGVTSSTSGWSTDITTQKITATKKYLWNCSQTRYTDGTSEPITIPTIIGAYGDKGANAKSITITPSAQIFKSTDGGNTFAPNQITITPTLQGDITFGKWQYSIDGGVSFADVVSGQSGLSVDANKKLTIAKTSGLFTDKVTMVTFRAVASDSSFYDTCSIAKLYDVTDIEIGGVNLIKNSNFANGVNQWVPTGITYAVETDSTYGHHIKFSSSVVGDTNHRLFPGISDNFKHIMNTTYTLSFYAKASANTQLQTNVAAIDNKNNYSLTTSWQKFTFTYKASAEGSLTFWAIEANKDIYLANIKLERGNKATDYTVSPEDVQTAILSTKNSIENVSSKVDTNTKSIQDKVSKTTYEKELTLVKGDLSKANEGLNKWRYEIYPKSLFDSEDQGKNTIDIFARNLNLVPSQTVLLDDASLSTEMYYGDRHIAYALTFIKMSAKKNVTTKMFNDDSASLYVNGGLISSRGGDLVGTDVTFTLMQGWNCLEVVVNEQTAGEGFRFSTTLSKLSECQMMNCYYGTPVARQSRITNQLVDVTKNLTGVTSTVQDVMTAVGNSGNITEFKNNYSKWKQSVDKIEQRVGETYVTNDKFDNLQIGGRNLVKNSAKWNFTQYILQGAFIQTIIEDSSAASGHCIKIECKSAGRGIYSYPISNSVDSTGKVMTISFYAKCNNSGRVCTTGIENGGKFQHTFSIEWEKITHTYTATKNYYAFILYDFWQTGDILYIKDLKIEYGNKPTDWTPAPEDDEINGQNLVSNLPANWEQGTVTEGSAVGTTYANTKSASAGSIRPKELIPVSGYITISTAYSNQSQKPIRHWIAAYDVNKNYLGVNYVSNSWNSFPRTLDMKDAKYLAIMVGYTDSSAITPSDISKICLKIERGTSATQFTLAPEDVNGKIQSVETIATQTADKFSWLVKSGTSSSNFELTDKTATLVADKINMDGLVTFNGLSTDAKNGILNSFEVGGRNLARGTSNEYSTEYTNFNGSTNTCFYDKRVYLDGLKAGDTITVHMYVKYDDIVPTSGQTARMWTQGSGDVTGWNSGTFPASSMQSLSGSGVCEILYSATVYKDSEKNQCWDCCIRTDYIQSGSMQIKSFKVEKGNKATDWTPAPEDVSQDATNKASQALTDAKNYSSNAVNWVTSNGASTTSLNSMVKKWTDGAVSDTTQINGGWIKANTITASKIAVGDFTNYCQLNKDTASSYGFTATDDTKGVWFTASPIDRDKDISQWFTCEGSQKLYVEYDLSTTVKGKVNASDTGTSYLTSGIMIFAANGTKEIISYTRSKGVTATSDGTVTHISLVETLPADARFFRVVLQTDGKRNTFSGTLKIRDPQVRKATTGKLIVDGSITANKIATDAIKSRNYISSGGTQGSFLNLSDGSFKSPNLSWDSNGNLIAKNANLSGQITATKGKIGSFNLDKSLYLSNNSPYYFSQFCAKKVYGLTNEGDIYIGSEGIYSYSWETGNMYIGDSGSIQADVSSSRGVCIENGEIYIYKSDYCKDYPTACDNKYGLVLAGGYVASANYSDGGSIDGFNFILTPNKFNINGKIYASNELQTGGDQIRIISGNIGCMVRNDSADFYILRTNSGDPYGGWTNDRPFRINWASNDITCGHNLTANDLIANSWVYCSEVHSSGAVVIASNSESYYWAHGYQMARGTSWGGVCIGDDSQGLRLYGTSIWASHSISTSDENLKENFTTLDQYEDFYMNLNPIGFNYIGDYDGKKTHFGFGAHKTEDILESEGYDSDKFAVVTHRPLVQEDIEKRFGKDVEVDIETEYGISYTEFIALNTHMIQKTRRELTKVKQEKADLEARLQAIEAKLGL